TGSSIWNFQNLYCCKRAVRYAGVARTTDGGRGPAAYYAAGWRRGLCAGSGLRLRYRRDPASWSVSFGEGYHHPEGGLTRWRIYQICCHQEYDSPAYG